MIAVAATFALLAGPVLLYLSARHQQWLPRPAPAAVRYAGWAATLLALGLLLLLMGPATAVFTWSTGLMLVWSLLPVVVAWRRARPQVQP